VSAWAFVESLSEHGMAIFRQIALGVRMSLGAHASEVENASGFS